MFAVVNENVLRLDVAVDNAAFVGMLKGLADLRQEVEHIALGDGLLGNQATQGVSSNVFHHQVIQSVDLATLKNGDDVGMSQFGQSASLLDEATLGILVVEIRADELDGDWTIKKRLPALVDDAHAAVAENLGCLEVGQAGCQLRRRGCHEFACAMVGGGLLFVLWAGRH